MSRVSSDRMTLINRLRVSLPLSARARQRLVGRLSTLVSPEAARSSLLVTDIFDTGEEQGLLCQLDLRRHDAKVSYLVVPLEQVALDRRYDLDVKPQRFRQRLAALRAS